MENYHDGQRVSPHRLGLLSVEHTEALGSFDQAARQLRQKTPAS